MRPGALIPIFLLVCSIATAQQLGPEIPVSAPGPLMAVQSGNPRVATNGSGFLAVWSDLRANGDVYATRLDPSGKVLDPAGIFVKRPGSGASVVSDGHDYLVAIADGCTDVSAIRVSADGTVGELKKISTGGRLCSNVEIASNGASYLVVWMPGNAALLDHDGNIISGPFTIGAPARFDRLAVASNGRDYLVAGVVDSPLTPVVAIPVSGRGDFGTTRQLFVSHFSDVAIASDGNGYVIASASRYAVRVVRLRADATPIGPEADEISPGMTFTPRIAWSGSQYVIGFIESAQSGTSVRFIGLDPNIGTLQSGATISSIGLQSIVGPFDTVGLNGKVLVAWSRGNSFAALASAADLMAPRELSGTVLASAPASQSGPMLISNGAATIAVWREGVSLLRGAVLSNDGVPLSPPVNIAQIQGTVIYRVAFAGTTVLATWISNGDLYARRFTASLQPIDADPVRIQEKASVWSYALAAGDGVALLAWAARGPRITDEDDIYGAIIRTDRSAMTVTPITIAQIPFEDSGVSAAWNGSEFLVAWAHATAPTPIILVSPLPPLVPSDIVVERISPDGHLLDSAPITVATFGGSTAAASNGRDFLIAWQSGTLTTGQSAIYGKVVGADGSVSATTPTRMAIASPYAESLVLFPADNHYILLWTVRPIGTYASTIEFEMIDANGTPGGFTLLPQAERGFGSGASLAVTQAGIVVAYDRIADEPQFAGVSRVFTRTAVPSTGRRRAIARR